MNASSLLRRNSRRLVVTSLILAGAAVLVFFPRQEAATQTSGGATAAPPPPEVEVVRAELRPVPRVMEYASTIDADQTVEVRARVEGFLLEQAFQDGTYVKKGDLLFRIDPRDYQAAVQQAEALLASARANVASAHASTEVTKADADRVKAKATQTNARKDLERIKPLAEADAVSAQELDAAEAAYNEATALVDAASAILEQARVNLKANIKVAEAGLEQAQAALDRAKLDLSFTEVTSPIDGRIGRAEQKVGTLVGRGENSLLATVSKFDPAQVYFSITELDYLRYAHEKQEDEPERDGYKPREWMKFELVLADGKVYPQTGGLDFVDRAVDSRTGTLLARAKFSNPNEVLRPGLFAKLRVTDSRTSQSLTVPQRAVQEQQGVQFVLVVDDAGTVERRKVTTGIRLDTLFVIDAGLKAGEQIIVEGLQRAKPGAQVRVKLASAAGPVTASPNTITTAAASPSAR